MYSNSATVRLLTFLAFVLALQGCSALTQFMPSHRAAEQRAQRMQELQLRVMRFADGYAGRVREAASAYQASALSGEERLHAQEWKVQQSGAAYTIASGSNPIISTLDIVVLATLSRMVIDDAWVDAGTREQGKALRDTHVALEQDAWQIVEDVLNGEQKSELREIIERWRAKHPYVDSVAYVHFTDFAAAAGVLRAQNDSPNNLFSLFGLDVFSGLDPAIREITQTRELAERSIFYLQRTPTLLDLEVERLVYELAVTPEAKGLLADVERISQIGSASDRLVTLLPELVARERAAAISQVMQEIEDRSRNLAQANTEIRRTLATGTGTAQALQETLATLDGLAARYQSMTPAQETDADEPFDIREYEALLREAHKTVLSLNLLAAHIETILPRTADSVESSVGSVRALMDRAFIQLIVLIFLIFACALFTMLAYHRATKGRRDARMQSAHR